MRSRISCIKRRLVFVWVVPLLLLGMYQTYVFGGSALVEKTGDVTSYSETGGDDGDLKKGDALSSPRFTDNGNGTVTDNVYKLIWLKNANAFGIQTWRGAKLYAKTLRSGSYGLTDGSKAGDWRLPNKRQLISLENNQWSDGDAFINVNDLYYWSRSHYLGDEVWFVAVQFNWVNHTSKEYRFCVWPVRKGK